MDTASRKPLKCGRVIAAPTFYEFFAGGGMARLGLGSDWRCAFANEWCEKKATSYRAYFGGDELKVEDVATSGRPRLRSYGVKRLSPGK